MAAKVSILMSVYNPNWDYLKETLDSIATQTFKDYELVIVNDGADETQLSQLLDKYDFEKIVVNNPVNLGLPRSLNAGLTKCSGEYIARIDDDDLMMPRRLEIQSNYLDDNSDVVSVFSGYQIINECDEIIGENLGCDDEKLKRILLYKGNCLCHSTMFARKTILDELDGYDGKMTYAQDYDLYLRMINVGRLCTLPYSLIKFRNDPERISKNKRILSTLFAYYASLKNLGKFDRKLFLCRTWITIRQLHKILKYF